MPGMKLHKPGCAKSTQMRRLKTISRYFLGIFFIAAGIDMAMHADLYPLLPVAVLWLRIPAQAILIAWAWWCTRE